VFPYLTPPASRLSHDHSGGVLHGRFSESPEPVHRPLLRPKFASVGPPPGPRFLTPPGAFFGRWTPSHACPVRPLLPPPRRTPRPALFPSTRPRFFLHASPAVRGFLSPPTPTVTPAPGTCSSRTSSAALRWFFSGSGGPSRPSSAYPRGWGSRSSPSR